MPYIIPIISLSSMACLFTYMFSLNILILANSSSLFGNRLPETFEPLPVCALVHDPADVLLHGRVAGMPRLALSGSRVVLISSQGQ